MPCERGLRAGLQVEITYGPFSNSNVEGFESIQVLLLGPKRWMRRSLVGAEYEGFADPAIQQPESLLSSLLLFESLPVLNVAGWRGWVRFQARTPELNLAAGG